MYQLIIRKKANLEAIDAALYYENERAGLGAKFLECLAERYKTLSENPELFGFITKPRY